MTRSVSLFNEFKEGGYDACLLTTFSVDFPFYEDVLLRKMQSSGISHHMLFVDKSMCLAAMKEREPCKVGSQYVLAPMECKRAFHPKVIMLLGKNKGLLAVGSHNVTLSGFGLNLEVTNVLRYSKGKEEYQSIFQSAFSAYKEWLACYGSSLPATVAEALERTLSLSPWLKSNTDKPHDVEFLYSSSSSKSLWQQTQDFLPKEIKKITGLSAFFDRKLDFVNELITLSKETPIIAVQPETVSAPQSLITHSGIKLVDVNSVSALGDTKGYAHAKVLFLEAEKNVLISGSANFSRPAWLNTGDVSNAEAVLLLAGNMAETAINSLYLNNITDALPVNEINNKPIQFLSDGVSGIQLLLIDDVGAEQIIIPVDEKWPLEHTLTYRDMLGVGYEIKRRLQNNSWYIARENYQAGDVICVESNATIIARIIILDKVQISQNSSTGRERQLQQALGSLETNNPEMGLLFNCFDQLFVTKRTTSSVAPATKNISDSNNKELDSLVVDLSSSQVRAAPSGRARCSTGGIADFLDLAIYRLGAAGRTDTNKAFNEDALGRTEEDLITAEDSGEDVAIIQIPENIKEEIEKVCQRKLNTILTRLENLLSEKACIEERYLTERIPLVLGVLVLTHELYKAQKDSKWVTKDYLNRLNETIYTHFLSEKMPVLINDIKEDDSVFKTDEWATLVGYVAWLSFHADVNLKPKLPLSAQKEEKDDLFWRNACWLFLAQRLSGDSQMDEVASKLLAEEDNVAASWHRVLINAGRAMINKEHLFFCAEFTLAYSSHGAFEGYRFIIANEGHLISIASINNPESNNKFQADKLNVLEIKTV